MTQEQANGAAAQQQTQALTPYQQRAIELREHISIDATPRAIVPRTFAEAQAFASALAHSSLIPDALKDRAPDILMIVLAGAEKGIAPITALGLYHVIEGVPKLSADGIAAVCSASAVCEYLEPIEMSDERVTWRAKKYGRPEITLTYTEKDAERAGLNRKTRSGNDSNHTKFPRAMKNARCKAELCRIVFPEICAGLLSAEEARDIVDLGGGGDAAPTKAAQFTAPPPTTLPPPPAAPGAAASGKGKGGKSASKPIDTTATAGASTTASSSSARASSSPPSACNGDRPPLGAPDPGAAEATRKAAENAKVIASAGADRASAEGDLGKGPTTEDQATPANANDERPAATTDVAAPDAASDASDDFGGEEATPARTIENFEKAVADCVDRKDREGLERVKADWIPWSKEPDGVKHAYRMRDAYARARTELGGR